jgi:hypothetical protein
MEQLKNPEDIISRAFGEQRALPTCGLHNYVPGSKHQSPRAGCKNCIEADFIFILASKKGDLQENLDQFEAIIQSLCELDAEGKMDFVLDKPVIHTQKDAA